MGGFMSFMGKGVPTAQMLNLVMGTLHRQFIEKDINNFEDFHMAILDIFSLLMQGIVIRFPNFDSELNSSIPPLGINIYYSTVNAALPGKHYDVPSLKEVEACFKQWQLGNDSEKKKLFMEFMKKKLNLGQLDDTTFYTGILTPPAAMVAKRAGESVPQLKLIKSIPDVIFVPSATVLALISVKISRKMFLGQVAT